MNSTFVIKPPKYLVCVDQRAECLAALRLACLKASARSGSVDMLHVVPPADFQTLGGIADRIREDHLREGELLLEKLADECQNELAVRPGMHIREGAVGDEIIAAGLADPDIIMLVIGIAHAPGARGSLASWLANQLGARLPIPLLMVPGNLTHQQLQQLI